MKISNLTDAISAVEYLLRRRLLCSTCGWKLSTHENQFHSKCVDCKSQHGEYTAVKPANEFEKRLCLALHQYIAEDSADSRADEGGSTGVSGS